MKVRKTIKGKIINLRRGKEELLKREYENLQQYLTLENKLNVFITFRIKTK